VAAADSTAPLTDSGAVGLSTPVAATPAAASVITHVPSEPLVHLFLRFLRFGSLAWGGPVAQIGMLRQTFVDEEKWVSPEHFNRVLAVYQILPGPEAHELCVYFGMLSRGRIGGILAGLGFMLPGFLLMFGLSWLYVRFGLDMHGTLGAIFASIQAAVAALIVRAVHRIGTHVLEDVWLCVIALFAFAAQLAGVHFAITLSIGGLLYLIASRQRALAIAAALLSALALAFWLAHNGLDPQISSTLSANASNVEQADPGLLQLFLSGLKAGLLTFGGAYTVIPFLQHDAVVKGSWLSNSQFLDGVALSGLLPAPLIIFSTFVGYLGGGPVGALLLTAGIFLPAFAFTLAAHDPLERLVHHPRARVFLKGLMAAVVGLIAGTAVTLLRASVLSVESAIVFVLALGALFHWHNKLLVPLVICAAAAVGWITTRF
jgi:chromate transporter